MSNHKTRLAKLEKKLEKQADRPQNGDVWRVRVVNYRAGIVPEIKEPAGVIPTKFIDYTRRNDDHKDPTNET